MSPEYTVYNENPVVNLVTTSQSPEFTSQSAEFEWKGLHRLLVAPPGGPRGQRLPEQRFSQQHLGEDTSCRPDIGGGAVQAGGNSRKPEKCIAIAHGCISAKNRLHFGKVVSFSGWFLRLPFTIFLVVFPFTEDL